ncbi:unnamed protein product, partial [Scytosiphon promiscuus]
TEIWEKALGRDHPTVATVLNNRAELLVSQVRAVRKCQEIFLWHPIDYGSAQQPRVVVERLFLRNHLFKP